jgi:hypothetical protein
VRVAHFLIIWFCDTRFTGTNECVHWFYHIQGPGLWKPTFGSAIYPAIDPAIA